MEDKNRAGKGGDSDTILSRSSLLRHESCHVAPRHTRFDMLSRTLSGQEETWAKQESWEPSRIPASPVDTGGALLNGKLFALPNPQAWRQHNGNSRQGWFVMDSCGFERFRVGQLRVIVLGQDGLAGMEPGCHAFHTRDMLGRAFHVRQSGVKHALHPGGLPIDVKVPVTETGYIELTQERTAEM